ncbi:MAG: cytochrome c peroxidase [Pricia sp.]
MNKHLYLILSVLILSCKHSPKEFTEILKENPDWSYAHSYYLEHITQALKLMDSLSAASVDSDEAKTIFAKVRESFKKAEPYASYLNPQVGHRANGPALPIYLEDTGKILNPFGLQKIEESIFEGEVSQPQFLKEVRLTKGLMKNLHSYITNKKLTPQRFFIATHQQLLRIISHSISGFDTPVSHLGINETIVSLEGLYEVYRLSVQPLIQEKNPQLDREFHKNIKTSVEFVKINMDFESFDRYTFIRDHLNPITRNWVDIRKESGLWEGVSNFPLNFDAPTFFENDSFNTTYFMPATHKNPTAEQITLGKKLFYDPNLSAGGNMACVTCHAPDKAFADGLVANKDNLGNALKRNTPTLINSVFQKSLFWDGRSPTLRDQISSVFSNEKEFASNVHQFSADILKDSTYNALFEDAFGKMSTKNTDIIRAISSYVSTLNGFNSKFDHNMRGEVADFTPEEKHGMNLFMGKALCATCHFMPLTNGTVPPFFSETEKEVIGVPETAANQNLDDDTGFYWVYNEALHKGMFKTPTVRNAEFTAPYMHNGVYNSLEEVMDFYNKGGGGGMGFDLEHQTLPFDELNLTDAEQQALVAFVKTLSDTNVEADKEDVQVAATFLSFQ